MGHGRFGCISAGCRTKSLRVQEARSAATSDCRYRRGRPSSATNGTTRCSNRCAAVLPCVLMLGSPTSDLSDEGEAAASSPIRAPSTRAASGINCSHPWRCPTGSSSWQTSSHTSIASPTRDHSRSFHRKDPVAAARRIDGARAPVENNRIAVTQHFPGLRWPLTAAAIAAAFTVAFAQTRAAAGSQPPKADEKPPDVSNHRSAPASSWCR